MNEKVAKDAQFPLEQEERVSCQKGAASVHVSRYARLGVSVQRVPAGKFPPNEAFQHFQMRWLCVEAGDIGEMRTARFLEILARFIANLIQCFKAVSGEAGRDDGNLFTLFTQFIDGFVRIGLKPLFWAKA